MKALGGGALAPREIEVTGGGREAPRLRLHGRAAAVAGAQGVELQVSLTHSRELAARGGPGRAGSMSHGSGLPALPAL